MRSLLASLATLGLTVNGYPSRYSRDLSTLPAGTATYVGMGQSTSTAQGDKCKITHNVPAAGFTEGTSYNFVISTNGGPLGMVWRLGNSQSTSGTSSTMQKTVAWTATGESLTAHALCGSQSTMHLAATKTVTRAAPSCSCADGQYCPSGTVTCTSCSAVSNAASVTCSTESDSVATSCFDYFYVNGGVCTGCQACSSGKYANGGCSGSSDTACSDCRTSCSMDQFLAAACTAGSTENRGCTDCRTSCDAGSYLSVRCPGNGESDTSVCTACKTCAANQYKTNLCSGSGTSDSTTCEACTSSCSAGQWLSNPCDGEGTSNTASCQECTPVQNGEGVTCTSASDSVVASCLVGYYANSDNTACLECEAVAGAVSAVTCTSATDSQVTDCGVGNYIDGSGTADVCRACRSACSSGEYRQGTCSGTGESDEVTCPSCTTEACPQGEARASCDGAGISDPACTACVSACTAGQFRVSVCSGGFTCADCTTDCGEGSYVTAATCDGSGTEDSTCSDCTSTCEPGTGLSGDVCVGTGSSDTRSCLACVAGSTFSADGSTCNDCVTCATGYTVATDCTTTTNTQCEDVDECSLDSTCADNAVCANTDGSFTCTCADGYEGDGLPSGSGCVDIDECAAAVSPCDVNADCTNTAPGYTCACNEGFSGDGVSCTAIVAPTPAPAPTPTPTPTPTPASDDSWAVEIVAVFNNIDESDLDNIEQDIASVYNLGADQVTAEIITRRRRDGEVRVKITIAVEDAEAADALERTAMEVQPEFTSTLAANPSASLVPDSMSIFIVDPDSTSGAQGLLPTLLAAALAFAFVY